MAGSSYGGGIELLERLSAWIGRGREPLPPADPPWWVERLESRYGIRIPEDFRRYLLEVAAGEDLEDEEMTTWWALGRIRNIPDRYDGEIGDPEIAAEAESCLFFADYMCWCWAWAVCCSDGPNRGRVAFIGEADGFVADSFSEFVERYLRDPVGMANAFPPQP